MVRDLTRDVGRADVVGSVDRCSEPSTPALGRRGVLRATLGLGLAATALGCSHSGCSETAPAARPARTPGPGWHETSFDGGGDAPQGQRALVFAPPGSESWPVLIALHGRGEAGRGLEAGARGWRDDYDLDLVRERLERGDLGEADVHRMLSAGRLDAIRASLSASPWTGLVIACPYTPIPSRDPEHHAAFGRFLEKQLLPRVAELKGGPVRPDQVGIDGVSMGGRWALELGFAMPEVFFAVGALQPAIGVDDAAALADRALRAKDKREQRVRLVTSAEDPFLEPTIALAKELEARKISHQLFVTAGPHDYIWNRGPGAAEMLIFHERALRGIAPPT